MYFLSKGGLGNKYSQKCITKGKYGHSIYHHTVLSALASLSFHKKTFISGALHLYLGENLTII